MKKTVLFSVGLSALVIAVGSVAVVSSGVADPPAEKDYSGLKPIQTSIIDDSADRIEMINKLNKDDVKYCWESRKEIQDDPKYDGLEMRDAEINFDAECMVVVRNANAVMSILKSYGKYDGEKTAEELGFDGYYELMCAAYDAYTDPSINLTLEEKVRLERMLEEAADAFSDTANDINDDTIALAEKIVKVVPSCDTTPEFETSGQCSEEASA